MEKFGQFGNFIAKLRINKKITLRNFAKKLNVERKYLSKLERGRIELPQNKSFLENIKHILELNEKDIKKFNYLYHLEKDKKPPELIHEEIMDKLPMFINPSILTSQKINWLIEMIKNN